jgi:thioredoxin-related protein
MKTLKTLIILLVFGLASPLLAEEGGKKQGEFLGARETVYPEWFKESFLDFREDVAEAAEDNRRVVLFFHQEGCPYCNLMVERNLSQKDISEAMQRDFDAISINMWGDREVVGLKGFETTEKKFSANLKVQFTPTLLFFDEQGEVVLRLNGYIPPETFKVAMEYVAGHKEKEVSYRDYLKQNKPPRASGKLNSEPFFKSPDIVLGGGVVKSVKPMAVFFEQVGCPNCDRLHSEVLKHDEVQEQIARFDTVQLDMWSSEKIVTPDGRSLSVREWAKELDVSFAPTIVLFDPRGKEVIRSEAFFKRFHTASIFDYVAGEGYRKEPSFQRYLSERAEHIRDSGQDVDIWK